MQHVGFSKVFFFSPNHSRSDKFESVTTFVQCEIWNLIFDRTRNKTELIRAQSSRSLLFKGVLLCLSYLSVYILEGKKGGMKKLEFC